jgi:hypothetical protein
MSGDRSCALLKDFVIYLFIYLFGVVVSDEPHVFIIIERSREY